MVSYISLILTTISGGPRYTQVLREDVAAPGAPGPGPSVGQVPWRVFNGRFMRFLDLMVIYGDSWWFLVIYWNLLEISTGFPGTRIGHTWDFSGFIEIPLNMSSPQCFFVIPTWVSDHEDGCAPGKEHRMI